MTTRSLELQLHGFGTPLAPAHAEVAELAPKDRLKRAATIFGAFIAVALIAIPIPIVHFVVVPGGLLLAFLLGALRLRDGAIFRGVQGKCPFCGTDQQFPLYGRFSLPKSLHCSNCGRTLTLDEGAKAA